MEKILKINEELLQVAMNLIDRWIPYLRGEQYKILYKKGFKPITLIEKGGVGFGPELTFNGIKVSELYPVMHKIWVDWFKFNPKTGFIGV